MDIISQPPICDTEDCESVFEVQKSIAPFDKTVIFQSLQHILMTDNLFHTPVSVENGPRLKALIDNGSMACTISEAADVK